MTPIEQIKQAILTTLVIQNPKGLKFTMEKIEDILKKKQ